MIGTVGSLFAGAGGIDMGMEAAGFRTVFQVEWDRECAAVLENHWPDVPRWGDVSTVSGAELPSCDVLTFGSPCQDLSVAGNRAGLAGSRSGLFLEAIRIIKEMRDATGNEFPRWGIWENVGGALSSAQGADFGAVLDLLADAGALVIEWAVLDARWFGVPQRRRRVFVVACFDPDAARLCPDPLLPVGARGERDSDAGGPAWESVADRSARGVVASLTTGLGTGGPDAAHAAAGWLVPDVTVKQADIIAAFDSTWSGRYGINPDTTASPTLKVGSSVGIASPPAIAFSENQRHEVVMSDYMHSLSSGGGKPGRGYPAVMEEDTVVRRLTPVECERLMGWEDDHTRYRADGTEVSDTVRYRMMGNGVVSHVATWIGSKIAQVTA